MSRLFIFVGSLSAKAFFLVVTGVSGFFGLVLGEVMTAQFGWSALAGALATGLAGVVLVVPRIMEQKRKSRESDAKLQSDAIALLINAQERDVAFYKNEIASLKLTIALHVTAKHNAVNEWSAMKDGYLILRGQLKAAQIEPEIELQPRSYSEIIGEVDQEIKAIAQARVDSAPNPSPK